MYMYVNVNSVDQHALMCSPTIAIRGPLILSFTFMLGFDAIRVGLFVKIVSLEC